MAKVEDRLVPFVEEMDNYEIELALKVLAKDTIQQGQRGDCVPEMD
ncbi:hypothetical protein [Sporosarcina sp.]|nr:hypothetical protein [Sporosarcina sp.]